MNTSLNPSIDQYSHLESVQALDDQARRFLAYFLTAPGTVADIATRVNSNLVDLVERMLHPDMQAAIAAIQHAAAQFAQLRALLGCPVALATLTEVAAPEANPNPADRHRAATTLLRTGCQHALRRSAVMTGQGHTEAPSRTAENHRAVSTFAPSQTDSAASREPPRSSTSARSFKSEISDLESPNSPAHPDTPASSPIRARDRPTPIAA